MNRTTAYAFSLLLSLVLTLLPAAMWADMAIPMKDNWENWYWKGQPHPRPNFSLEHPPTLFRAEASAYKALVAPPAFARRLVRGWPTSYAFFMRQGGETAGVPPLAMALEHAAWAIPLWFVCFAALFELVGVLRRHERKRRPSNSQ